MLPCALRRLIRAFALIAAMLFTPTAGATFHLWVLNEIYSDASGTVQYIELYSSYGGSSYGGQEFVTGHSIVATQDMNTHVYFFPTDLPGDSTNHHFLIGTQGLADLGVVTPDYVVPNGFLFLPNGSVNFAAVDILSYSALPTDGVHALNRSGQSVVNSPTNFGGLSAVLGAASTPAGATPVYRFNNTQAGVHFYTALAEEKDTIIANYPWFSFEGTAFYAYAGAGSGRIPIYRFNNTQAGVHFYTGSEEEKNFIIANYPWFAFEGISYYATATAGTGTVPLYRFNNTQAGAHFYTASEVEKDTIIASYPWFSYEGIAYYVRTQP